jgi:NTE family protein
VTDAGSTSTRTAFVLGGGGHRGAYEVGMLKALIETGIQPDVVVGTSIGAINGVAIAADPSQAMVDRLVDAWHSISKSAIFRGNIFARGLSAIRYRTHLHSNHPLSHLIENIITARRFEDLPVHFECVAACIEDATEHWFNSGPLVEAVLASSALPGVLPAVEMNGRHYIDGGVVNSIPVSRAIELGATELYVLQVGHIDEPLEAPRTPWDVAMVTFEISRRHRFLREIERMPSTVGVHVLPTGKAHPGRYNDLAKLRFNDFSALEQRIAGAYEASREYLSSV